MASRTLVTTLLLAADVALCSAPAAAQIPTEESLREEGEALAGTFARRTGISIAWVQGEQGQTFDVGGVTVRPPLGVDVASYLPWLLAEFSIYPEGLLRKMKVRGIVLSRGLTFRGVDRGGLARPDGTLYLDVLGIRGAHNIRTIHHELFHLIQRTADARAKLDGWDKLNVEGYAYGSYRDVPDGTRTKATPGIVSLYAHKSAAEDQAELFSWMMVDPTFIERMSGADEFLAKKVVRIRESVAAVDRKADDAFWKRLVGRTLGEPLSR